ncbi:putative 4-amino-4-deoxy-L-arabinose-phosphoundecaprenol flippase subunit ArnE [Lysobacter xinjiangensis]|uniref:4-amino-4-deoxy-L-arabinose-phosphoundecaprenol flippase subunit ArnE n=1 Tax=Cognatilysobacter xinjiangensis TaxID=546892 RepID=A0ABQ3CAH5_9GAMM|nr:EamA family transporter [Lysobacter xinjiangensis]GGZ71012.1 putative 4-amino-4-deoxy-L-arabinose-phosphoundecaprenol flippase subunit ArnE [Lysobacter xinjiangensis]
MVAATIFLTSYGQLVLKWQANVPHAPLPGWLGRLPVVVQMLARPWVLSAFVAAFGASLCWMMALSRLELSRAYPFMALNFLLVTLIAIPLFGESLSPAKIGGLILIVAGLIVISQGAP